MAIGRRKSERQEELWVSVGEVVLGEYRYNAAHWRVEKIEPSPGGTDVRATRFVYDAAWRPILEESIDDYDEQTADWDYAARARNVWGLSYIDEVLARAWGPESDEASEDERFTDILHYVSGPQFSVVAVLDRDGLPAERVRYDAYGNARHSPSGDIAHDAAWFGDSYYHPDLDRDFSGDITPAEIAPMSYAAALPEGWISERASAGGTGNEIGYAGYLYDRAADLYTARHRQYDPRLGRWLQRDPAGYVDGFNLYQYVNSSPIGSVDPYGLEGKSTLEESIDNITDNLEKYCGEPSGSGSGGNSGGSRSGENQYTIPSSAGQGANVTGLAADALAYVAENGADEVWNDQQEMLRNNMDTVRGSSNKYGPVTDWGDSLRRSPYTAYRGAEAIGKIVGSTATVVGVAMDGYNAGVALSDGDYMSAAGSSSAVALAVIGAMTTGPIGLTIAASVITADAAKDVINSSTDRKLRDGYDYQKNGTCDHWREQLKERTKRLEDRKRCN